MDSKEFTRIFHPIIGPDTVDLFCQADLNGDGLVSWDDLTSYMLLEEQVC
jgi:hypothetical protein